MSENNLRDEIAIKAMVALISIRDQEYTILHGNSIKPQRKIAYTAYKMADAMIYARREKNDVKKSGRKKPDSKQILKKRRIETLKLRVVDNKSFKKIAEKYDRTVQTIKKDAEKIMQLLSYGNYINLDYDSFHRFNFDTLKNKEKEDIGQGINAYKSDLGI